MITRTLTILIACGVIAGGCGSSGSTSSTAQTETQSNAATSGQTTPKSPTGTSGSVASFGHRASAGDRASVLTALHAYLSAIAAGDWSAACDELSTPVKQRLEALLARSGGGADRCVPALSALLGHASRSVRRKLAQVDVIEVRTNGDHAFVLYRSAALSHASISMLREDGRWTAGVLSATVSG